MVKKCSVCDRVMTDNECGDEFPEERVCDECAGILPSIKVYEWRTGTLQTVEVIEKPILAGTEELWFRVDIRFEDGTEHYADYNEKELRWESSDATNRNGEVL